MTTWWIIGIFIIDLIAAYTWAESIQAIEKKKAWKAGLWAGGMYIATSLTVISFTQFWWLMIPAVIGCVLGTALSVKLKKDEN